MYCLELLYTPYKASISNILIVSDKNKSSVSSNNFQEQCSCDADSHGHFHCSHCQYVSRFKFAVNRHVIKAHTSVNSSSLISDTSTSSASVHCESAAGANSPRIQPPLKKAKYDSKVVVTNIIEKPHHGKTEANSAFETGNDSTTDPSIGLVIMESAAACIMPTESNVTIKSAGVGVMPTESNVIIKSAGVGVMPTESNVTIKSAGVGVMPTESNVTIISAAACIMPTESNVTIKSAGVGVMPTESDAVECLKKDVSDLLPVVLQTDKKLSSKKSASRNKKQSGRLKMKDEETLSEAGCVQNKNIKSDVDKRLVVKVIIDLNGEERTEKVAPYSGPIIVPTSSPTGKKLPCPLCKQRFVRVSTMRNHLACSHDIMFPGQSWFHCVPCKFVTSFQYVFASHRFSLLHLSVMQSCQATLSAVPSRSDIVEGPPLLQPQLSEKVVNVLNRLAPAIDESQADLIASTPTRSAERQRLLNVKINRTKWFYCGIPSIATASQVIGAVEFPPPQILWNNREHVCTTNCNPLAYKPVEDKSEAKLNPVDKQPCRKLVARKSTTKGRTKAKMLPIINVEQLSTDVVCQPIDVDTDNEDNQSSIRIVSIVGSENDSSKLESDNKQVDDDSEPEIVLVEEGRRPLINNTSLTSLFCSPGTTASSFTLPLMSYLFPNLIPPSYLLTSDSQSNVTTQPVVNEKPLPPTSQSEATISVPRLPSQPSTPVSAFPAAPAADTATGTMTPSLDQFSPDDLWSELYRRGRMRSCACGVNFMDVALFLLHRSCHSSSAPLRCAFCSHDAASCYDFHGHLLDHKK